MANWTEQEKTEVIDTCEARRVEMDVLMGLKPTKEHSYDDYYENQLNTEYAAYLDCLNKEVN